MRSFANVTGARFPMIRLVYSLGRIVLVVFSMRDSGLYQTAPSSFWGGRDRHRSIKTNNRELDGPVKLPQSRDAYSFYAPLVQISCEYYLKKKKNEEGNGRPHLGQRRRHDTSLRHRRFLLGLPNLRWAASERSGK